MKNLLLPFYLLYSLLLVAQSTQVNYDEALVPTYELPPLLGFANGDSIEQLTRWPVRRQQLLKLFGEHVYGHRPSADIDVSFRTTKEVNGSLRGLADLREVDIVLRGAADSLVVPLLLYLPVGRSGPVPVMLGLNFYGNHIVSSDPNISLPTSWIANIDEFHITDNRATDASRGARAYRWDIEQVLARGYAFATVYYGDLDPDRPDHWQDGVHPLFYRVGQTRPDPSQWGAIGAWAYGYSRAVDYLLQDGDIDPNRIVAMGHSRIGKAVLWAGANDERIALVISNNSGCGGAALSRRDYGETVKIINDNFPHWFNDRFVDYGNRVQELPVDQHELIALLAPRPVYIASAIEDRWADPRGEFLAAYYAGAAYQLFGLMTIKNIEMPPLNHAVEHTVVGYHLREGGHGVTPYDWTQYLDFADHHLSVIR